MAYWRLDEHGVNDCSSNNHNGSFHNGYAITTMPNGDNAAVLDGNSQYAEVADDDSLSASTTGQLTIEAWLRPDVLEFPSNEMAGYVHWLGKGTTSQHEYVSRIYSLTNSDNRPNRISGYAYNISGGLGVGSYFQDILTAGQWIHYVLVINTTASDSYPYGYTKIFKNGILRAQDSLASLNIVPQNGTAPLRIGTRDLGSYLLGAIGKVAVYNHELDSYKINQHYQNMVPPPDGAQLVANLGNASSQTNGNTLTIPITKSISAGHTIITRVLHDYTSGGPTMTDSKGNIYSRDRTAPASTIMRASIFSSRITTPLIPGDTLTITLSASVTTRIATADEFSNLLTTAEYLDGYNNTSGNSSTPNISLNTANSTDLLISMVGVNGGLDQEYSEHSAVQWTTMTRVAHRADRAIKQSTALIKMYTAPAIIITHPH